MEFKAPIESYKGRVREVEIGKPPKAIKLGGESRLPFHDFDEGEWPNPPRFALELWDVDPGEAWPDWLKEPYREVLGDPAAWARKCVEYGADAVCLKLVSTDPAGRNAPPESAVETVGKVLEAIDVPLIVYGVGDEKKDPEVLPRIAEAFSGRNLLLGPALKEDYEPISEAAQKHGHAVIAQTPLDINLMKELNVKLSKTFPPERIVIDPLSSALGYGMEYSFTLMERTKQAGVMYEDAMTQMPIIADLADECWKTSQARESKEMGIMWEAMTALTLLLAGANILILLHPESLKLLRELISQ